jgi:hypothetical protein
MRVFSIDTTWRLSQDTIIIKAKILISSSVKSAANEDCSTITSGISALSSGSTPQTTPKTKSSSVRVSSRF